MSNQIQKRQWATKGDPNALSKAKWCTGECGGWIYWDPLAEKTKPRDPQAVPKMIPQDVFTGDKHECPRSKWSPKYDENMNPVEQPEDIPGNVIDAYNQRKKEHKQRLEFAGPGYGEGAKTAAQLPEAWKPASNVSPVAGAGGMTERQHNEIIAMHGLTQNMLGEIRDYLEVIAKSVMHGPGFPADTLSNLREEHEKVEARKQEVVVQPEGITVAANEEGEKAYQNYLKETE